MKMNKITSLDFLFPNNEKELGEDSIIGKSSKNRDRDLEFIYKEYNNLCIENQKIPYYEELNSRIHNYNINLYTLIVYKDLCREYPSHTDVKYGWTSLSTARVEECREGYYLSLPRPKPLI